ncbi:MAG: phosphoglycerate kinase [Hyphomicrobiaceae bacterium]
MDLGRLRAVRDADVRGKRVIVRADLNVPAKDGKVTDATRLERIVAGLRDLSARGARTVVISHFGRPKGRDESQSLKPVAEALAALVGTPIAFASDCVGPAASGVVDALRPGAIAVLENLRFHAGEEKNDAAFVAKLAKLGDIYVNDAFSAAHRAHASTEGLAHALPAYAGPLMMEEIDALRSALEAPKRPVAAIVGGAKVSTKIPVLENLAGKVDHLVIGGGMANTFLLAKGLAVGKSLAEPDFAETARKVLAAAEARGCAVFLPTDAAAAAEFKAGAAHEMVPVERVPAGAMILDFGPASATALNKVLDGCATVLWNGPLGAFEIAPFDAATNAVARHVATLTKAGKVVSVAGGGDTVAALNAAGVAGDFSYVSSAGGAFLEWLEGRELPGVAALAHGKR